MNKFFYQKLAINNMKKNSKTFIPYLLTCIGTIAMFYNMVFLMFAKDLGVVSDSGSVRYIMFLGAIVIGIFSLVFLFYTNSFLIKRRKKEFGLFNVLGMEKKHIVKIMFYESLFTALISIGIGLTTGILLSKLMILLLFKLISFDATFGFEVPINAVLITIELFFVIFFINLIYNIRQVHLSNAIELLKGGNVGEKEPKSKWFMTISGAISLGMGYYIAVTTESPLAALNLFFVAVLLVIVGTYNLFTAGSITVLKALKKNKKYYYKARNFISVSSMTYRMKQNATGLANICILSTAVIVMISSTVSLYIGMEDALRTRFPRNISISVSDVSDEEAKKLDSIIEQKMSDINLERKNIVRTRTTSFVTIQDGSNFKSNHDSYSSKDIAMLVFITQDEFNKLEGTSISLNPGESLIYTIKGESPGNTINIDGYELSIKEHLKSLNSIADFSNMMAMLTNSYYIIVDDLDTIAKVYNSSEENVETLDEPSYYYGFDVDADSETQIQIVNYLNSEINELKGKGSAEGAETFRESFYSMYGSLFFLGIFLGLLFIMATVLIIYYKQIAEGYDDKERFEIMQKVGMSREEVWKSIKSQVLTVFFLPLFTAIIHIGFAFKVITQLLTVFNLTNITLYALCTAVTIIVFALLYSIVYMFTARTYYKIVS